MEPDTGAFAAGATAPAADSGRLDSWKEIAGYLRRGMRTVQRWEREEDLPVHRLLHEKQGSVYAYRAELDAWFQRRAAVGGKPATTTAPSLAVLPFADMSPCADQGYFCDGIAEEIISALSRVEGLRTVSRSSSFRFRGTPASSREAGRELGVSTLLEGSVRKSGDRLRIAVELIDAASGFQLWTRRYDRGFRDIFEIQDEIAESVVQALRVTLTPNEGARLGAGEFYRRARKFYYEYNPRSIEFAIRMFCEAVKCDPDSARAYAGMADCWSFIYLYEGRSEAVREQAEWASLRALEMDPQSAEAHSSRGLCLSLSGRNDEADAAFAGAISLDPGLFEAHYFRARHCFALGRREEAVAAYEAAMRARPDDFQAPLLAAQIYAGLGRHAEAAGIRRQGVAAAERHLQLNPDDARALYLAANGLAALGKSDRARRYAEAALLIRGEDPVLLYNLGCIFALLGAAERALNCLEKAARAGLGQKAWYEHDSDLDSLRTGARFQQLMRTLNTVDA